MSGNDSYEVLSPFEETGLKKLSSLEAEAKTLDLKARKLKNKKK